MQAINVPKACKRTKTVRLGSNSLGVRREMTTIEASGTAFARINAVRAPYKCPILVRYGAPFWRMRRAPGKPACVGTAPFVCCGIAPDRTRRNRIRSVTWCAQRLRPEGASVRAGAVRLWRGAPAINLYPFGADEECGEGLTPAPPPNSVQPHQSDTRKRDTQTWLNAISRRALLIRWTSRRPPLQGGICAQAAHITEFQMAH